MKKIKKCWLCVKEIGICFPKITKIGMLQYGIPNPQKIGSNA